MLEAHFHTGCLWLYWLDLVVVLNILEILLTDVSNIVVENDTEIKMNVFVESCSVNNKILCKITYYYNNTNAIDL